MTTYQISKKFQTRGDCISYLEKLRWGKKPICAYCGSKNTYPYQKEYRHHCKDCSCSFSVLVGTAFEETRLELPKYFMLISMMLSSKKGISSSQLARDLGIPLKTAWYATMRMRCAMIETITDLKGVVEADESYIGGKPRKKSLYNKATLSGVQIEQPKRGRGADKVKISGFVERDGRVAVKILDKLTAQNLLAMLHKHVKEEDAVVMTDKFKSYNSFDEYVEHFVINHSTEGFSNGKIHVNTIEGFWGLLKSGIKGQYVVLSKKYLPFYLAEFTYKYNRRNLPSLQFESFMKDALSEHKCMICYHPEKEPTRIAYPAKKKPVKANVKKFNEANKEAGFKRRKDANGIIRRIYKQLKSI